MSVRYPAVYKDSYIGAMKPELAEYILKTRQMEEVPALKNMIYDFPIEMVEKSLLEKRGILSILSEEGIDSEKYRGSLRGYQTVGVAFMYLSPRSILGDGVGSGKTAQIAGLINLLRSKGESRRFFVAVETSALNQTKAELIRFTGLNIVSMVTDKQKFLKTMRETNWQEVDGIVVKHSALRSDVLSKWMSVNINPDGTNRLFDTFFFDESSAVKNDATKIYDYTHNICNITPRIHFLNATAFETHIMDIYYQVDILNPDLLPRKTSFQDQFRTFEREYFWKKNPVPGQPAIRKFAYKPTGYKNQAVFKQLVKFFYFGRSRQELGLELPHQYLVYEIEATIDQKAAIKVGYPAAEVLNAPSLVKDINIPTDRKHVPKLDRCVTLITDNFPDARVLVYCFYLDAQKALAEALEAEGKKVAIIQGSTSDEDRYIIQSKFNTGKYDVLITNIKKSLNLPGGDVCILYSMETNPAKMEQIRGRIDRNVDESIKTFALLVYDEKEMQYLKEVIKQRAKDARELTIDARAAVDYFMEAIETDGLQH